MDLMRPCGEAVMTTAMILLGVIGAIIAISCLAKVLVILFVVASLSALAAGIIDAVPIPVLLACLALLGFGLWRRQRARACCSEGQRTMPEQRP
jgi:mercuric ion transport protein